MQADSACDEHPRADAAWSCVACGRRCCPACVARVVKDETTYDTCVHCDGPVRLLTVPGSVDSLTALLVQSLRAALGLPTLVAVTGVVLLAAWGSRADFAPATLAGGLSAIAAALAQGLTVATGLILLAQLAAGGPDEVATTASGALLGQALRTASILAPVLGVFFLAPWLRGAIGAGPEGVATAPAAGFVSCAGGAALPPLVLWLLLRGEPGARLRFDGSLRSAWAACCAAAAGLGGFAHLMLWNGAVARRLGVGLWAVGLRTFALLALLVLGWGVGLFLHVHASAFGFPLPERFRVPRVPGATPRGTPRPKPASPPRPRGPIALD